MPAKNAKKKANKVYLDICVVFSMLPNFPGCVAVECWNATMPGVLPRA